MRLIRVDLAAAMLDGHQHWRENKTVAEKILATTSCACRPVTFRQPAAPAISSARRSDAADAADGGDRGAKDTRMSD
jgi:hypothetical protein